MNKSQIYYGYFLVVILVCLSVACNNSSNTRANARMEFSVSGMSCEVGCAGMIESAVKEMKGVGSCNIYFEDQKGVVEFDTAVVNQERVVTLIEELNNKQYEVFDIQWRAIQGR